MQYVGRALGSVSKTWNSINPATLSGAIDVIVIELENGDLNCSPFHVRFGKFSTLRPSQKKVEFRVNGEKVDLPMKLGEGGEAFFVFETEEQVPDSLITSPVISPSGSPEASPQQSPASPPATTANELVSNGGDDRAHLRSSSMALSGLSGANGSLEDSGEVSDSALLSNGLSPSSLHRGRGAATARNAGPPYGEVLPEPEFLDLAAAPPPDSGLPNGNHSFLSKRNSMIVQELTRKFTDSNIPSVVGENGEIVLDMTGYKSTGAGEKESERKVREILENELGLDAKDLEKMIALDNEGRLRISSPEPTRLRSESLSVTSNSLHHYSSDPSLHDFGKSTTAVSTPRTNHYNDNDGPVRRDSAISVESTGSVDSSTSSTIAGEDTGTASSGTTHYVKTLRLTSDQLKKLTLRLGKNDISFSVNQGKAVCTARIFYWTCHSPIVISDIDGTITKSDALGHVLTMLGRDWTHLGVGKLFTDIHNNGYNIMYLTSRSVGQADSTRSYLRSVDQEGFKLPDGPVILSPDRTMAALRREMIVKKPEIFKMACLRDIQSLFGDREDTPFYAGFGNRITDALSYRSVGVPKSKIFTINSDSEVHMELLELAGYKSSYVNITDLVDHFFPPVSSRHFVQNQQQTFTDANFWREPIPDVSDLEEEEEKKNNQNSSTDEEAEESFDEEEDEEDEDEEEEELDEEDDNYSIDDESSDSEVQEMARLNLGNKR